MTEKQFDTSTNQDTLYAYPKKVIEEFSFNLQVVDVFSDMISRSVPSYQNIAEGIGKIASKVCTDGSKIYDLGCSLGNISLTISKYLQDRDTEIIGIDNSVAMVERARQHIDNYSYAKSIKIEKGDLVTLQLQECDMAVTNFTLQFVKPEQRQSVVDSIYQALKPGGVFVLSEKILIPHNFINDLMVDLHHDFKRENGYSDLEISQKRTALENVMRLDGIETHLTRLKNSGFESSTVWYQHFNFVSILAYK